jgi:hypothetical protein
LRANKIIPRRFATDPFNDHRRRQQLKEINQRRNVIVLFHQDDFLFANLSRHWSVFDSVQVVNFHGVQIRLGHDLCRRHDVFMSFAWQPPAGAETAIVAKGTSPQRDCPVNVWASETRVQTHPLDSMAENLLQIMTISEITQPFGSPVHLGTVFGSKFI